MTYVDGFVIPIREDNVDAYRQMAEQAGKVWREHGALEFRECIADDLEPDMGEAGLEPQFPAMTGLAPGETVVFSWIVFRSRAHRDEVNAKVMEDPRITAMMEDEDAMPFDPARMAYGGFEVLVDL